MLALVTVFEYLSNVRRLLNRFYIFRTTPEDLPATTITTNENALSDSLQTSTEQQSNVLLEPILKSILSDDRLEYFDGNFLNELERDTYFAGELDACLLEMHEIERDLLNLKQRQCYLYEQYMDFIDKKDQLIDKFIEYHDEYLSNNFDQSLTSISKHIRQHSITYEFNVPVSNRFDILNSYHAQNFE